MSYSFSNEPIKCLRQLAVDYLLSYYLCVEFSPLFCVNELLVLNLCNA